MNKAVNTLSGVLAIVYVALAVAIVYDLSFSSMWTLKGMAFKEEVLGGIAVVVLLLGLIRVRRRWQGINDMKRFKKFTYETTIAPETMRYSLVFTILEMAFMIGVLMICIVMFRLHPEYTVPMIIAVGVLLAETTVFLLRLIKGGPAFRFGINKDVVAYFDREMHLYYYTGLLRIELVQSDLINFQYKEGLNLFLTTKTLRKEDRAKFRDALIETLAEKNVYIDDAFRVWE